MMYREKVFMVTPESIDWDALNEPQKIAHVVPCTRRVPHFGVSVVFFRFAFS
jgi:hypothetical protein